ncbi:hypothetical protein [Streptomyces sp. NPDC006638]|uniref:hypothetical protein n=1 Tax=Streptomyces sp. NPDC006638 TaxID=3157183 RepID=UPI0033AD7586
MTEQITDSPAETAAPLPPAETAAQPETPQPASSPPGPPGPSRPSRRALRAVARWTVAVLVFAGLGGGIAYGISDAAREDVPGLATKSDGRWQYPKLSLPALPAAAPRPFSGNNAGEIHHADPRALLLPAPAGAVADKRLTGGWVSEERFLSEYELDDNERSDLLVALRDAGLRHIAARGWTMPDGTSSRVYLLTFPSTSFTAAFLADELDQGLEFGVPLKGSPETVLDESWTQEGAGLEASVYAYEETEPYGSAQTRQAYVRAGDTLALVVHERPVKKGRAAAVPFHQTLILQDQLLN